MVSTNEIVVESAPVENLPKSADNANEEDFERAQKKFQQGKKNLLLNKYDDAVNNIGDACKLYSIKYGEFAPECAEIYFYYGKALLELARVENTVLGNALNGVPEDTGPIDDSRYGNPDDVAAEEKEKIADEVIDAMCEQEKPMETTDSEKKDEPVKQDGEVKAETKVENGEAKPVEEKKVEEVKENGETPAPVEVEKVAPAETEMETKTTEVAVAETPKVEENGVTTTTTTDEAATAVEAKKDANGEAANDDEEEGDEDDDGEEGEEEDLTKNDEQAKVDEAEADDISNLQRSWEMFELAKLVYTKHFDSEKEFKLKRTAECLLKLGEIGIEQELYEQAIGDIKESIRMHEEAKERDERMLAESFYQLGLAYQFNEQFQDAGESYQKSINILQLRIDKLKIMIEQTTNDEFEKTTLKDEINELETILPEMVSKLEEINEQGQQSLKLIKEAKECFLNKIDADEQAKAATNGTNVTSGEVKDITSLVKSKRKISSSQISENPDSVIKKTKMEDETAPPATTTETTTTTTTTTDALTTNGTNSETTNDTPMEEQTSKVEEPTETPIEVEPIVAEATTTTTTTTTVATTNGEEIKKVEEPIKPEEPVVEAVAVEATTPATTTEPTAAISIDDAKSA